MMAHCDPGVHLSGDPPEEPLALVAVGGAGGGNRIIIVTGYSIITWWRTTGRSCAAWWRRWGRSGLAASSCTRGASEWASGIKVYVILQISVQFLQISLMLH